MQISLKKIVMWIFILRPIIDLFWNHSIVAGINLAGVTSIVLVILLIVYCIAYPKIILLDFHPQYFFGLYVMIITVFYFITYPSITSLQNALRVVSTLSILIILVPNMDEHDFEYMIKRYLLSTLIPIAISFLQVAGIVEYTYWDYVDGIAIARATGGYRQPSHLSRYLVFGIMYVLYLLYGKHVVPKHRKYCLIYIILATASTVVSYHRTGYLCVIIVLLIYLYFTYRKDMLKFVEIGAGVLVVGLMIMYVLERIGALSLDLSGFRSLLSINNIISIGSSGEVKLNLRGRSSLVQTVFDSLRKSPFWIWLFGVGGEINNYSGITLSTADMDFLAVLWNYGIIGIMLWAAGILKFIRNYSKCEFYRVGTDYKMLVLMSVVIYIIFGLTIEVVFTPNFLFHIYLINGFLIRKKGTAGLDLSVMSTA